MRDKKHEEQQPAKRYLIPLLVAFVVSLILSLAFLLLFAALVSGGSWSQDMINFAAPAACLPGAFVMGIRCVAAMKSRALLMGIAAGLGYFLVILLLGSIFFLRAAPVSPVIPMLLAGLIGGLAAGVLGALKKPRVNK